MKKVYKFGKRRKAYSNSIPVTQAQKELADGWSYIIKSGEIIGIAREG